MVRTVPVFFLALATSFVAHVSPLSPKKAMIWVANPLKQTTLDAMIADLKSHRSSFTGIAYQYFAICGQGSNDDGGSKDCPASDAKGEPHLSQGHPVGVPLDLHAQLKKKLDVDVELWPTISYGNPGNANVLNRLLANETLQKKFAADAVVVAKAQNLTGFNFDLETLGMVDVAPFLKVFGNVVHASGIKFSYDALNYPVQGADADRWISMATYTSDINAFRTGLKEGLQSSGEKFGVGLCPSCAVLSESAVQDRFDAIQSIGKGAFRELDMWAYGATGWDYFWPRLQTWLASDRL